MSIEHSPDTVASDVLKKFMDTLYGCKTVAFVIQTIWNYNQNIYYDEINYDEEKKRFNLHHRNDGWIFMQVEEIRNVIETSSKEFLEVFYKKIRTFIDSCGLARLQQIEVTRFVERKILELLKKVF